MLRLPTTSIIELTNRCNHNCIFCYCPWEFDSNYINSELSKEEWFNVIDTYKKYGIQQITFSGGEPLMRDDLFDILDYINYLYFLI